ncbi:MAG: transcription-repair coupling factor [Candidatus Zixiibacteriota bacterium]|nr:MAG: transcription-repair coupling factor [candidate division Zixibacteria bacterium]
MNQTVIITGISSPNSLLPRVFDRWLEYEPFVQLVSTMSKSTTPEVSVCGLTGSSEALLISALQTQIQRPVVVVTEQPQEAQGLYEDLLFLVGEQGAGLYPARQILPYDFRAPIGEVLGQRISTLSRMAEGHMPIVICSMRALMEPTITPELLEDNSLGLHKGGETDIDNLVDRLVRLGFRRVPVVEEVGDFARRGGLIDFFSPGFEAPVRVEFFGDEVDTIRQFDVSSQRTLGLLEQVSVLPKREIPITQETLESYLGLLPEEDAEYVRVRYLNDPELPGLEWLSLLFDIRQGSLLDYLDESTVFYLQGKGSLRTEAEAVIQEAEALHGRLRKRLTRLPTPDQYYRSISEVFDRIEQADRIDRLPFKGGKPGIIDFHCKPHPSLGARLDLLADTAREFTTAGIEYFIATDNQIQGERLQELVSEKTDYERLLPVEVANLKGGFVCDRGGFAVLTDHEIFGRYHRRVRKKKFKEGVAIADYSALDRGDYVVHTDYGIARFLGLETIVVDGKHRDCLTLEYAERGRLYVPIEEFNRVSKYSGKDTSPGLTRLGGPGWEKLKKKTRKAIDDMAEDLIKLYAQRKSMKGFTFSEDTVWLKQLESSFQYEETRDQQRAIDEVKYDMTQAEPMDRLVCGDVGYGKTEVAIRAAFKAIEDGKQVAVLVPTTVLAQQHFQTFSDRMREFPVKIAMLSRFRTRKQQAATVKEIAAGQVELVIGTHRLFSKDVRFKDLGLLIIDEEHRFGVRHKEKLRQLKANVDTIAMTATPIPRTMQMSLMGARDMSIIETSPKDRLPIITEIVEFDPGIIATAILREINRGGQVFFLHNRVQTIEAMHRYLKKLLPQAEIGVAHGQMHERSLEGVMLAFMEGRFNVLLCTAIIESGLDIPTANTIIINRADRFGLAELYQIRGRVGRSSQRAFAYLLTPPTRLMTGDAIKRLRALEAHSDLGSGFALAMRDLEIRGAGTVLGARQSGFIEEIGFDLYNKLLEEAVARLKGQEIIRLPETKLEIDYEVHLPAEYIPDNQQKVDVYRRLADSRTLDEVEKLREETEDRFGKPPQSAVNLFDAAAVKISASLVEIDKVKVRSGIVNLFFAENRKLTRHEVESFRRATDCPLEFSLLGRTQINLDLGRININERLAYVRGVLGKI